MIIIMIIMITITIIIIIIFKIKVIKNFFQVGWGRVTVWGVQIFLRPIIPPPIKFLITPLKRNEDRTRLKTNIELRNI
jgi:hypothetical protein